MKKSPLIFFVISLVIFVLDQFTKHLIKAHIGIFDAVEVTSFFNIVHVNNTGSAFGMFKSLGNTFFIVVALAAMVLVTVLIIRDSRRLPFALVLGGAAGNITDRILIGHVTDFLDFHIGSHHWPAFNVADSALTVGIILLLAMTLFEKKTGS